MPKAKQVASQKVATPKTPTKAAAKTVNKKKAQTKPVKGKATPIKEVPKPAKGKATPIKEASKPIKKSQKSTASQSSAAKSTRPSNPPKRPAGAYILFCSEMQGQMKDMEKFKDMPFKERTQVVTQSWQKLTDAQKGPYNQQAEDAKKRYEKELKQFEKQGYYKTKDGKDSRDIYKAPKKSAKANADEEMNDEDAPKKKSAKVAKEAKKVEKIKDFNLCKPKMKLSAFCYFFQENRVKIVKKNPDLSYTDIGKQNGQDWKNITDSQRKKFDALAAKDAIRHEKETKEFNETGFYTNSDGVNSKFMDWKHRVKEFPTDTVMPKRPQVAYMFFSIEYQKEFMAKKKEDEKYNVCEVTKKISQLWKDMTDAKKAKYEKLNQKDQERYKKQLDDIRKKGFFTTEDGVKSTDLPQKIKKVKRTKRNTSTVKEQSVKE